MKESPEPPASLALYLHAVGLCAPGLVGWNASRAVLAGRTPYREQPLPPLKPAALPRNEARRASFNVRLAIQVAQEALAGAAVAAADCCSVFACAGGNSDALEPIFTRLAGAERTLSPTQFTNTVHSAPAGYWSLAAGYHAPYTSIAAYDASFSAGLLEAACLAVIEQWAVLLVAYDAPPPPALLPCRPVRRPFAAALLLSDRPRRINLCRLELALAAAAPEDRLADPGLEALRLTNPAARSLPLLGALAAVRPGSIRLPYLPGAGLQVRCAPCC